MRRVLLSAAAAMPMLALMGGAAWAACPASGATTSGADIELTTGCVVTPKTGQAGVTINSSNNLTVDAGASVSNTDVDNTVGVEAQGGNAGNLTNNGQINLLSSFTPTQEGNTGFAGGPFTTGQGRIGMLVVGPGTLTGNVTNGSGGSITVDGNTVGGNLSGGIVIETPITGSVIDSGSISITGNQSIGIDIAGAVGGNVSAGGAVTAAGVGAQGLVTSAPVAGSLTIGSGISVTGYRSTTAPTGTILQGLAADQVQQAGSAVVIGDSVQGGVTISPAITTGSGSTATTTAEATITQFGSAPAVVIGASGKAVNIGNNSADPYGLVVGGFVSAQGVYDPKFTPSITGPISATGLVIGQGGTVNLNGGLHVTGAVEATALDATSTAIILGTGTTAAAIVNDGTIEASEQGSTPQTVGALLIQQGAHVGTITNTAIIAAVGTDTVATSGAAFAIVDKSGTVSAINNTGTISASLSPTAVTFAITGPRTAIDVSAATNGVAITQSQSTTFGGQPGPQFTGSISGTTLTVTAVASGNLVVGQTIYGAGIAPGTVISAAGTGTGGAGTYVLSTTQTVASEALLGAGALPTIAGDILFGQGTAGQQNVLSLSAGNVSGAVSEVADAAAGGGAINRFLQIAVAPNAGQIADLDITKAEGHQVTSLNVGSGGILTAAVDPTFAQGASNPTAIFDTTVHAGQTGADGTAVFASGAQIGIALDSIQTATTAKYVFVHTSGAPGALTIGNLSSATLANAPFLYDAVASSDASNLYLTVTLKSPKQLGLNASGTAAFNAIFAALEKNTLIGNAIIAPTTAAGFINLYYQMVPDQGIGTFESLEAATERISNLTEQTPDAGTRIAGTSAWLQEVNQTIKRNDGDTLGETDKVFGLVGGYEHMGQAGGAIGLTAAYLNIGSVGVFQPVGGNIVTDLAELGAYYRRAWGGLRFSVRGAGGYAWFNENREFVTTGVSETSKGNWNGYFVDAHVGAEYEANFGRFYLRPEVGFDYLYLTEDPHSETGAGQGFDITINRRTSERGTGYAILTAGAQFGHDIWFRPEIFGGYREVAFGQIASTTAAFSGGGLPFTLAPGDQRGGWVVAGFSLKAGTPLSYVAIEGEADLKQNEQRYDVYLSGRAMF